MREREKDILARWVVFAAAVTTLAVSPWWTYDPINVPKMSALVTLSVPIIFLVIQSFIRSLRKKEIISLLCLGFFISIILSLAFSGGDRVQQIYGSSGRNTGALTLIAFLLIFIGVLYSVTENFVGNFSVAFIGIGVISAVYGVLQYFQLDRLDWINPYSPVIGFLGNPNFHSSFIGICFVFVLSYILSNRLNIAFKVLAVTLEALFLFNIYGSQSQQGFIIIFLGSAWLLFNVIKNSRFRKLQLPYSLAAAFGALLTGLGAINLGPLSSLIYTESVTYRGDYWRAGIKMFTTHPIFGVGMDSYGDWYTRSRDLEATIRRGGGVVSNAAHNVFIDMAANGGISLLVSYLAINVVVVFSIFRTTKKLKTFDPFFVGISGSWIAFQAQSVISINQIGLSVWGWALSGSILGYSQFIEKKKYQFDEQINKKSKVVNASLTSRVNPKFVLMLATGLVCGCYIGLPSYLAEVRYMTAIQSGDATVIQSAAYLSPNSPRRMIQVAAAFQDNELEEQALRIAIDASAKYPDYLDGWKFLYQLPASSPELKKSALDQIHRLDPLNPEFK